MRLWVRYLALLDTLTRVKDLVLPRAAVWIADVAQIHCCHGRGVSLWLCSNSTPSYRWEPPYAIGVTVKRIDREGERIFAYNAILWYTFFFFFCNACSMWKFLGQGLNLIQSSDPQATRELPFFLGFIEVQLTYKTVIVSAVQQYDLIIRAHTSILFQIFFPHRLSQNIG